MPEYIDVAAARAFVEANYQGDPLLRHLYGTLLDKLPAVPDSSPMFLLKSAPADADILKTLASSPVTYSTEEETIIPLMPDRWIPVTERLPESLDFVVALTTGGDRIIAKRDKYGWLRYGGYECERLRPITHWMPLPEPPKEVE